MLNISKIRQLRLAAGYSYEQAATKAGFKNRQRWYAIENGDRQNVELATLNKIARALGVKAKELLK